MRMSGHMSQLSGVSHLILVFCASASALCGWPTPRSLSECTSPAPDVHVVATILRRRWLGKKLAFVDLGDPTDDQAEELQALLRSSELDSPVPRHSLSPGGKIAVRGSLRVPAGFPPTLCASSVRLERVAPCEHAVRSLRSAARDGDIDALAAFRALIDAVPSSSEARHEARLLVGSTLAEMAEQAGATVEEEEAVEVEGSRSEEEGRSEEESRSEEELISHFVRRLQAASDPVTVGISRSGGGLAHSGLTPMHQVPALRGLQQPGQAAAALDEAQQAGGMAAAVAALDALALSTGEALATARRAARHEGDGWVTVEAEVLSRFRLADEQASVDGSAARVVLLALADTSARAATLEEGSVRSGRLHCVLHSLLHLDVPSHSAGWPWGASLASEPLAEHRAGAVVNEAPAEEATEAEAAAAEEWRGAGALDAERHALFDSLATPGARVRLVGRFYRQRPATGPTSRADADQAGEGGTGAGGTETEAGATGAYGTGAGGSGAGGSGAGGSGAGGTGASAAAASAAGADAAVLLVYAIRLEGCASAPRAVRATLDALADGKLTDAEAVPP